MGLSQNTAFGHNTDVGNDRVGTKQEGWCKGDNKSTWMDTHHTSLPTVSVISFKTWQMICPRGMATVR